MAGRVRVGIIGCGLIAQVMHLHYLRELADRFEIAAVCDVSEEARASCAREYGVLPRRCTPPSMERLERLEGIPRGRTFDQSATDSHLDGFDGIDGEDGP